MDSAGGERRSGHFAWSYMTDMTLEEQQQVLAVATSGGWQMRESAYYGDYLAWSETRGFGESIRLRVFEEQGKFVIDLRWASDREGATPAAVERWVLDDLLPELRARQVQEDEGYD